jgi:hypothetical protein
LQNPVKEEIDSEGAIKREGVYYPWAYFCSEYF